MKRERAQLSVKNPCHIPKHRYYELKHFCLQYPDWKKALVLLDGWNTEPRGIPASSRGAHPKARPRGSHYPECSTPAASTSLTGALRNLIRHWHRTLKRA